MSTVQEQLPCPVCGGSSYSWGDIVADKLKYIPRKAGFFERCFNLSYKVPARLCDKCGNIQMFSEDFLRND